LDEVDRTEVLAQVATALAAATDLTEVSEALIDALSPLISSSASVLMREPGTDWEEWRRWQRWW
jgi:hypothetical protein